MQIKGQIAAAVEKMQERQYKLRRTATCEQEDAETDKWEQVVSGKLMNLYPEQQYPLTQRAFAAVWPRLGAEFRFAEMFHCRMQICCLSDPRCESSWSTNWERSGGKNQQDCRRRRNADFKVGPTEVRDRRTA